ncbi:hypothetical protein L1077_23115 [Pseudoalteromonas luteoviolacea]|uniref:hypothetical protein n=1 Tax=Pseudoalteromonas luteoviolacea TaxID=43657 RepID=UPI001F2800A9|nr:hypothetical protein [Pseudoalteromonas luteoviolacea]MCF6442321.1 hypothetical protein [Pseudoalteromonas luteoviolacea]
MDNYEYTIDELSYNEIQVLLCEIAQKSGLMPPECEDDGIVLKALSEAISNKLEKAKRTKVKTPF